MKSLFEKNCRQLPGGSCQMYSYGGNDRLLHLFIHVISTETPESHKNVRRSLITQSRN